MENLFLLLGIILIVVTLFSLLSRFFKQPLILAYIAAGLALGPLFLNIITPSETLTTFAQIGVAFLLFMVGLNLNLKVLKEIGLLALILGIIQVLATIILSFIIAHALGFATIPALYIGLALAFSSTIIVIKLLSDKNDLDTFYGRISVGVLIVQDLIALIALMLLTGLQTNTSNSSMLITLGKGALLFITMIFASKILLPNLYKIVAHSSEQLFITSIAWCFLVATFSSFLGFSIEIGAFLAGISLAILPYHYEITGKVIQLRDFFLVIFFVNLGLQTTFTSFRELIIPALMLSFFVLIGKPLIIMLLLSLFGYRKHIGFRVSTSLAQISEFSLILIALGTLSGHLTNDILSLITLVGIITITLSSYLIIYNDYFYKKLERVLNLFEKKHPITERPVIPERYDTVLFGCYRMGSQLLDYLQRAKKNVLVIDINPDIIRKLERKKTPCIYGDASDHDVLKLLNMKKIKAIISTVPKLEDTKTLLRYVTKTNKKIITIVTAQHPAEAVELYHEGASYVITPHLLSAELVVQTLRNVLEKKQKIKPIRIKHLQDLTRFTAY